MPLKFFNRKKQDPLDQLKKRVRRENDAWLEMRSVHLSQTIDRQVAQAALQHDIDWLREQLNVVDAEIKRRRRSLRRGVW